MSVGAYIKRTCFKFLSQDGIMRLKDGREFTAKQFVEQFLLQNEEIGHSQLPSVLIPKIVKSEDPWKRHEEREKRLKEYYKGKTEFMSNSIEIVNNNYITVADIAKVVNIQEGDLIEVRKVMNDWLKNQIDGMER